VPPLLILVIAVVVVVASGVRLNRAGRPYGTVALTTHKLVNVGAVVYIGVLARRAQSSSSLFAWDWTVVIVAAAVVLAAMVAGGVVTATEAAPPWVARFHRVTSWIAAVLVIASTLVVTAGPG